MYFHICFGPTREMRLTESQTERSRKGKYVPGLLTIDLGTDIQVFCITLIKIHKLKVLLKSKLSKKTRLFSSFSDIH